MRGRTIPTHVSLSHRIRSRLGYVNRDQPDTYEGTSLIMAMNDLEINYTGNALDLIAFTNMVLKKIDDANRTSQDKRVIISSNAQQGIQNKMAECSQVRWTGMQGAQGQQDELIFEYVISMYGQQWM